MSDGTARFDTVRLPRDTARMLDAVVTAAVELGKDPASAEGYRVLCYARKWLAEHVELLCAEAGVGESEDDQLIRFL